MKFENGNDKELLKERLGDDLIRINKIPFIDFIKQECDKRKINFIFDYNEYFDGKDNLIYTEFFGGLGGIILRPTHPIHKYKSYTDAINDNNTNKDFSELVKTAGDKYKMNGSFQKYERIIIFPGSNCIHKEVNHRDVMIAVAAGAKIKPHPLTCGANLDNIKEVFGADNVLDPRISGFELVKNAELVYCTKQSELTMYAILLGKVVRYIEMDKISGSGCYRSILKFIDFQNNKKDSINKLLNSWKSGVFFPDSNKEDICKYLDYIGGIISGRKN